MPTSRPRCSRKTPPSRSCRSRSRRGPFASYPRTRFSCSGAHDGPAGSGAFGRERRSRLPIQQARRGVSRLRARAVALEQDFAAGAGARDAHVARAVGALGVRHVAAAVVADTGPVDILVRSLLELEDGVLAGLDDEPAA